MADNLNFILEVFSFEQFKIFRVFPKVDIDAEKGLVRGGTGGELLVFNLSYPVDLIFEVLVELLFLRIFPLHKNSFVDLWFEGAAVELIFFLVLLFLFYLRN